MWYFKNRFVRGFSDRQARLFGSTSANMISVYRILLALAIPFLVIAGQIALAAVVFALSAYLDFLDGAIARYQQAEGLAMDGWRNSPEKEASLPFFRRLRLKGCTETGKWLDPLADKILIQATLLSLGWRALPHALLAASFVIACLLTCARPFKAWMKRRGLRKSADGRANAFGKIKMWIQTLTVALLFLRAAGGMRDATITPLATACLIFAALFATLSLTFHLLPPRIR